jgi:hypothetical protein
MTAMTSPSWARVRGPLAPYAGGFRVELERLGYTPLTAATHVRLMAHLSRWLAHKGAEAPGLLSCPALHEKKVSPHVLRHYVDGRVMWPEAASPLVAEPRGLVPAT